MVPRTHTFSIIIPVYNEVRRIPASLGTIMDFFRHSGQPYEIICVDDGSTDATRQALEEYQKQYSFQVFSYPLNRGKGFAVRHGVRHAKGDWIVFFDIDLATPLSEFTHLLSFLEPTDEVVIGSRRLRESDIRRRESNMRTFLGHGFTKLSNLLVPGITDFTCGFKCFSRPAAQKIFSVARIDRWSFDTELLYIAKLKGMSIRQMPVAWAHDSDSRVRVSKAVLTSLADLCRIKWYQFRGLYR